MLRLTLASARGHLARFLLTAFSVMLGVSFVAGTFVLSDSIDATLTGLLSNSLKGVDVTVRSADSQTGAAISSGGTTTELPLALEQTLAGVPGVARVVPEYQGSALIAGRDGTAVGGGGGAPGLGFAFRADSSAFTLVQGRGPTGPGEVAVEQLTLEKAELAVGDRTQAVIGGQTRAVLITGEVTFGSLFGATAVLVDEATARTAFAPDGTIPSFSITAASGTSQEALRTAVAAVLPDTAEAVTGATMERESAATVKTGLGFFTTFLLVFAGVALFVGSFIIINTFSMLVAQRTRELALLRALGASRGQVLRMVLGEAALVGLVGSGLGLGFGMLIAAAAQWAIRAFTGADVGSGLPVHLDTVAWSLLVGTAVTLIAAAIPARRASRTAPMAAMRADSTITSTGLRLRGAAGAAMLVVGAIVLGIGVWRSDPLWTLAGIGAALTVLGMLVAAPAATRPVVRVITWPFERFGGVVGTLARESALRVPRRTASTASALMIGLALIAAISVLAASVKTSVAETVTRDITSDFVLTAGAGSVPAPVGVAIATLPGVGSVARIGHVDATIGSFATAAVAIDPVALAQNFALTFRSGRVDALGRDTALVDDLTATARGWTVGTRLDVAVGALTREPLTIAGIFKASQAFSAHLIVSRALYLEAVPANQQSDDEVYVKAVPGTDAATLHDELVTVAKPYLVVSVQDRQEFSDATGASVDTRLNLLYVLLLFSVIVAVLGIVNTLALSVFERTREIGLLRAVGLRRRQLSEMITIEAIATAVFGAVLGTVLGLGLGVALQHGLVPQGVDSLAVSWPILIAMIVAAGAVGVLAAVLPALRAVRLDILTAIATDG
ncbi:MAG: ABC transporter permease [Kineosporiaceae bacterium]|nr:ABC transporter permease [Kineosporiaceae bacterium]MBK7624276.1 ABC transporter permease [Kineosporiaceae bacterium]MBK8075160.1 ABC transporter permease [Kineosporiaceae bacterium]